MVLKHRPLPNHPNAMDAAIALQAARRQGKAGRMHKVMLANHKQLQPADILRYAAEQELDVQQFKALLDDPTLRQEVESDMAAADKAGATGTPTTFINGVGMRGAQPYGKFSGIVATELVEADKLISAGTKLADVYDARCKANVAAGSRP